MGVLTRIFIVMFSLLDLTQILMHDYEAIVFTVIFGAPLLLAESSCPFPFFLDVKLLTKLTSLHFAANPSMK